MRLWIALSAIWLTVAALGLSYFSQTIRDTSDANDRINAMQAGKFSAMAYLGDRSSGECKVCVYAVFDQFDKSKKQSNTECNLPLEIVAKTKWGSLSEEERKRREASNAKREGRFVPDWELPDKPVIVDPYDTKPVPPKGRFVPDWELPEYFLQGLKRDDVKAFLIAKEQEWHNERLRLFTIYFALIALLPPLLLLAFGYVAAWVISGFRSDPKI
jgi:hypothetical protein